MPTRATADAQLSAASDAALAATRVFVGIAIAAMDGLDSLVSLKQFRTLVLLTNHGPMNVGGLAELLEVHPSNATRMCDRLVEAGLVKRAQSTNDRRHLCLSLTTKGKRLVTRVMRRRQAALDKLLVGMSVRDRDQLARALTAFVDAAEGAGTDAVPT